MQFDGPLLTGRKLNLRVLKSYTSIDGSVGCLDPENGLVSMCACALSWHQSFVQNTPDQLVVTVEPVLSM